MPGVGTTAFPSLADLTTLCRVHVNDTFKGATLTPGEGRVFVDGAPFVIPIVNASLEDYQRDLENSGVETMTGQVFFTNVPPVNSGGSVGTPDPSVEQQMNFNGFFDGFNNTTTPALPPDLLAPKKIWQRNSGSGLTFSEVYEAPAGLISRYQDYSMGEWEWRGNSLFFNGSIILKDMRLRYTKRVPLFGLTLPTNQFAQTPLPFMQCLTPLSLLCAEKFCASRLPAGGTADLLAKYRIEMDKQINGEVRKMQAIRYSRPPYGDDGGADDFAGSW